MLREKRPLSHLSRRKGVTKYYDELEFDLPDRRARSYHLAKVLGPVMLLVVALGALLHFGTYDMATTSTALDQPDLTRIDTTVDSNGPKSIRLSLKHVYHHNTEDDPQFHARLDVTDDIQAKYNIAKLSSGDIDEQGDRIVAWDSQYSLSAVPKKIRRMSRRDPDFIESYLNFARLNPKQVRNMDFEWIDEEVLAPNVSDRDTVIQLAYMASNAYVDVPFTGDWTNVSKPWDGKAEFGWMSDGVRGHVFVDDDEQVVVISIKGTSAAVFDSGGDTAPNDKINDNLLFSCCCARISYLWNTVCDCYTGDSYTCDQECLEEQLYSEDRYYRAVLDVYRNVTELYPHVKNIWVAGHSLGGSLSALLGRTYGLPVFAIEAPAELLATKRLHLPTPPGVPLWDDHIWHFGHTADPVYMGVCNGAGSSCWIAGYAMETQCHTGLQCIYDTVEDLGWHVSMVNHRIHVVIDSVLMAYNDTAECIVPPPCTDCFNWKFVIPEKDNPSISSTTTKSPKTKTSTVKEEPTSSVGDGDKCVRRAWYGKCLEYGPSLVADSSVDTQESLVIKGVPAEVTAV